MAPSDFSLRVQHGITGGFAPPTPSAIYAFSKTAAQPSVAIASFVRPDGTPELQPSAPKSLTFSASGPDADQHEALVNELEAILKELPTEVPPGSEDIYGMDTAIFWADGDGFQWMNGGPQGCGSGTSSVQATAEQKKMFARAVEITQELLGKAN